MGDKTKLRLAILYKTIYEAAAEDLEKLKWWDFRKVKVLRDKIRWSSHHYSLNIKEYKKSKNE